MTLSLLGSTVTGWFTFFFYLSWNNYSIHALIGKKINKNVHDKIVNLARKKHSGKKLYLRRQKNEKAGYEDQNQLLPQRKTNSYLFLTATRFSSTTSTTLNVGTRWTISKSTSLYSQAISASSDRRNECCFSTTKKWRRKSKYAMA
jgi:hypothetical protein